MAPAAELYAICVDTEVDLANAAAYAVAHDITIINHSVGWFNSSRGDGSGEAGTPDAIVAAASDDGVLWVNAAGNCRGGALERHVVGSGWKQLPQLFRHRRGKLPRALPRRGDLRLSEVGCLADDTAGFRLLPRQRRRRGDCSSLREGPAGRDACRRPRLSATKNGFGRDAEPLVLDRPLLGEHSRRGSISSSRSATHSSTRTPPAASSSPRRRRALSPSAPSPGWTTRGSPTAPSAPRSTAV